VYKTGKAGKGNSTRARDARAKELELAGLNMERDLAGYIQKPFAPPELLVGIETALRRRGKAEIG
jgi:DNA-binding response OmpR family regulator